MAQARLRLGDILIAAGKITDVQLKQALDAQKAGSRETLGAILIGLGFLTEKDLVLTLSQQLMIPHASREQGTLKPKEGLELQRKIPEDFARKNHVLPLDAQEGMIVIAVSDPLDIVLLDNIKILSHSAVVQRVIATKVDIEKGISDFYGETSALDRAVRESYEVQRADAAQKIDKVTSENDGGDQGPAIQMADLLIRQAIRQRASDIHIEPFRDRVSVRLRVDGILRDVPPPARHVVTMLVSRIKVLSKMDISEKRLPQDGGFSTTAEGRAVDFRVSTIPTVNGEKVVMRLLDRSNVSLNLEKLGFDADLLTRFRKQIYKPYGLILVTGPTGSGKTTTLYSALNELKTPERNILTVEDPVEYQIDGINQVEVKSEIGLTFSVGLRAFLRQDPDVILVGEIRDLETAQICIRAALTGHLVFSTLHTNDAATAVNRLADIGVEPFFVGSSLLMIVAQRLIRRLCLHCREADPTPADLWPLMLRSHHTGVIYHAKGCDQCNKSGYQGRIAVHEILFKDAEIERLVTRKAGADEIRTAARRAGMVTLIESGYHKVAQGHTSLEEVARLSVEG